MSPITAKPLTLRTVLGYLGVLSLVALLLVYVGYQARFIVAGPMLDIYTENSVSEARTVTVEGQARNIVGITLNDRPIYTDERGYFKETVVLENGYTIATLRAKDRYGHLISESRTFVYKPLPEPEPEHNS